MHLLQATPCASPCLRHAPPPSPEHRYPFTFFLSHASPTTEIYTLSLHDALPIFEHRDGMRKILQALKLYRRGFQRSEEHTSELQSLTNIVCRLLLEKKKTKCFCRDR